MIKLPQKIQRLILIALQSDHDSEASTALSHARRLFRDDPGDNDDTFSRLRELDQEELTDSQRKWVNILLNSYEKYGNLKGRQVNVLNSIWDECFGLDGADE